jgi:hypothetical protein
MSARLHVPLRSGKVAPSAGHANPCNDCDEGTYAPNTGMTGCINCEPGKKQPSRGSDVCPHCHNGQHQANTRSTVCHNCAAGSYAPNDYNAYVHCIACEKGRYHTSIAHTGPVESACIICSSGRYTETTGTVTCNDCENGGKLTNTILWQGFYCISTSRYVCNHIFGVVILQGFA